MNNFCPTCENIFIHKEDFENKKLNHYCNKCDLYEPINNFCIYTKTYNIEKKDTTDYKLLSYDNTLPKNIATFCPKCKKNNVSYVHNNNIIYICKDCKYFWKKN